MHLSTLIPVVAIATTASAQLHELTVANGKQYFGSATDNYELKDAPYKAILVDTKEFGQITPGNAQKWAYSEPQQGVFSHTGGDEIVALTQETGQILRCHTLVWHSQAPNWINNGVWTNDTLIAAMKNHIKEMVTHYKGKCAHWDVVNEAFNEDGTYRKSPFSDVIGPEFIPIAFETAAQYDPDTKLYYNDYNLEYNGAKAEATRKLVASLKARGIKIDGVGLQAHMIVAKTPGHSALTSLLNSFTTLDVDVTYTEIDVRFESLPPTAALVTQQATDYVNIVMSCINVARCVGLTIWDYTDKYSWIPSTFNGQGDALLWDKDLVKKPAYTAVINALKAALPVSPTPTTTSKAPVVTSTTTIRPPTTTPVTSSVTTSRILTTMSTTTRRVTTSLVVTSTTSAAGGSGTVPRWGQCGGNGWTGGKVCVSPWVCKFSNDWYSQCL